MKAQAGYTDPFLSPMSGIHLTESMLPPIIQEYTWVGNRNNTAQPSPALIDIRLDIIDLRHALSAQTAPIDATYILQKPNKILSNAQALNQLNDGIMLNLQGVVETSSTLKLDQLPDLSQSKIWVGDENNRPIESDFTPAANDATYIIQIEDAALKNAQVLNDLGTGMAKIVTGGAFAIAIPDEDYATKETLEKLAQEAKTSAEEAAASAEEAAGAAEEATAAASEATGAAAEATGAAGEASLAAGEASLSALGATASAFAAGISAGSASSSASDAKSSASDASDSAKSAGKSAQDAATSLHTLLTTPVSLIGDVQGSGLLTAPIPTAFKENPVLPGRASMTLPQGTSADRPPQALPGMLRYNSTP